MEPARSMGFPLILFAIWIRDHAFINHRATLLGRTRHGRKQQGAERVGRGGNVKLAVAESMTRPTRRVMIVDDHDAIRRGVRQLIETKPYFQIVGEAADGRTGLKVAKETRPDIAVLDYSIPELNGLDLAHALKREFPHIEILLYTMHDREEIIMDVLRAGVRGFILKSDAEKHLLAALDSLSVHRSYFSGAVSDTLLNQFLETKPHTQASSLTHREREVVQQVAEGRINKEIAARLSISLKTVETHRASAMRKLKLRTTADLVRYAVRNQLVQP